MDKNIYKAKAAVVVWLLPAELKDKSMGKGYKSGLKIAINWVILFLYLSFELNKTWDKVKQVNAMWT